MTFWTELHDWVSTLFINAWCEVCNGIYLSQNCWASVLKLSYACVFRLVFSPEWLGLVIQVSAKLKCSSIVFLCHKNTIKKKIFIEKKILLLSGKVTITFDTGNRLSNSIHFLHQVVLQRGVVYLKLGMNFCKSTVKTLQACPTWKPGIYWKDLLMEKLLCKSGELSKLSKIFTLFTLSQLLQRQPC